MLSLIMLGDFGSWFTYSNPVCCYGSHLCMFDTTGGAGIVCGLATYGYKIMRVLGVKSVKMTNSRGFCVELSTAITVIVASRYGKQGLDLPTKTVGGIGACSRASTSVCLPVC